MFILLLESLSLIFICLTDSLPNDFIFNFLSVWKIFPLHLIRESRTLFHLMQRFPKWSTRSVFGEKCVATTNVRLIADKLVCVKELASLAI